MDYSRILLTDDGSPLAASAAPYAAAIAHAAAGEVLVLRVAPDAGQQPDQVGPQSWVTSVGAEPPRAGGIPEPFLRHVLEGLSERGADRVGALVVRGDPRAVIPEVAQRLRADIVVMASHGYSGVRRAVVGSVTDHVARHLGLIPILVCHGLPPAERDPFQHVGVALDESLFAEAALEHARALVRGGDGTVELIRVLDIGGTYVSATVPWSGEAVHTDSSAMPPSTDRRRPVNPKDLVVPGLHLERVVGHDVGAGIVKAARSTHCGIIVMSSRGRGPLARAFYGSVGDQVARQFTCGAVLLVHPDALGTTETAATLLPPTASQSLPVPRTMVERILELSRDLSKLSVRPAES